jgi:hypothetical protein
MEEIDSVEQSPRGDHRPDRPYGNRCARAHPRCPASSWAEPPHHVEQHTYRDSRLHPG